MPSTSSGASAYELFRRLGILIIKPDTIVRRRAQTCLSMLERSHFDIDAAFPLTLTPEKVRALWRFQFNAITDGGQALREHFYAKAESLLVVAQSSGLDRSRSASSRLALLKGAEPCRYDPGSIRAAVGAINKVFDGLHCADEPIDVLREMGVIFGERQLQDAYRQVARSAAVTRFSAPTGSST